MNKHAYSKYVYLTNLAGSNKAASYVKAIEWLCRLLEIEPFSFSDCKNIWVIESTERIHELYEFTLLESKKGKASLWNIDSIPISYLRDGFCSAALKSYEDYLIEKHYENELVDVFDTYNGDESELSNKLDLPLNYPKYLIEGLNGKQGEDIIRAVRVRSNQNVFRKMILSIYNQSCCITGLNIPDLNRASHIIPWSKDEAKRLDPTNGLCLSATYDAAFDRNLISLDDDYRLILSKNLREYATNNCVKEYFLKKEGMKIDLPEKYKPNKDYLTVHRNQGDY